jgi:hypothetical protein
MDFQSFVPYVIGILVLLGVTALVVFLVFLYKSSPIESGREKRKCQIEAEELLAITPLASKLKNSEEFFHEFPLLVRLQHLFSRKENNYVPNLDLANNETIYIERFQLFYMLQSFCSNLFRDGLYEISSEDLRALKNALLSGNLFKSQTSMNIIHSKVDLDKSGFPWATMLCGLVHKALSKKKQGSGYALLDSDISDRFMGINTMYADNRSVLNDKYSKGVEDCSLEERTEDRRRGVMQLRHDIAATIHGKRIKDIFASSISQERRKSTLSTDSLAFERSDIHFLGFDYDTREVSISINYLNIFSREFQKVVGYLRKTAFDKGLINKITVYLYVK